MRRIISFFLIVSMFLLPALTSCYKTTYDEGGNPTRPEQAGVEGGDAPAGGDAAPEGDAPPAEEPPAEEAAGE